MLVAAPADWLIAPADAQAPRPDAAAPASPGGPVVDPLTSPVLAGGSFRLSGSGFTSGSVVNFFVSTAKGAANEGPLKPSAATSTALTLDVPPTIALGQGVVALQVVNTDQSYVASNLVYALLQGSATAGIPSLTAINGVELAATSTDPRFAIDNVETVIPQGADVLLQGAGFDVTNGVAVDVFCACPGGKVGPFFINPGNPALSATSLNLSLPLMGPYALPVGPASLVVSNAGGDGKYAKKSNAVSVPIGRQISVLGIIQEGNRLTVDGTGLSTLTVLNFYDTQNGNVVNLGGLAADGAPAIPITLISDTELTFEVPAPAAAGPAYVQALNPPFIPFSSSGNDPNGAFILFDSTPASTATPTPLPTSTSGMTTPSPTPTPGFPTATASATIVPSATPSPTPVLLEGVLLLGGADNTLTPSGYHPTLATAEIYDPATGSFSATGSMASPRLGATVTALDNGEILVAGGHNAFSNRPLFSAELYDIGTGTFSLTGSMNDGRLSHAAVLGHAAALLWNGTVLVSGGINIDFSAVDLAEIYDPDTGQFTPTTSLLAARAGHSATVLLDGRILIAGGADDFGILASAELRNTQGDDPYAAGPMSIPRQGATATLLGDGRVLIAGGATATSGCNECGTDTAEIFDPATNTFAVTGRMHAPRRGHCANLLANGKVLIAGGFDDAHDKVLASAELYDPATGIFILTAKMSVARFDHTGNALPGGKVLIAGGFDTQTTITNTAELYDPATGTFAATGNMTDSRAEDGASWLSAAGSPPPSREPITSR